MAIIHVMSMEYEPSKQEEAKAWTDDIIAYVKSDLTDLQPARALIPAFGPRLDRVVWVWEHASLAAYEQETKARLGDAGYMQRVRQMGGIFTPGTRDSWVYRDLS